MSELLRPLPPRPWRDRAVELARTRPAAAAAVAAIVVAAAGAVAGLTVARSLAVPPASGVDVAVSLPGAGAGGVATTSTVARAVVVHVSGAVTRPGLVEVAAGARVAHAVDAAGGPAPDADVDRLNLAAPVADGARVHVPRRGEPAATAPGADADAAATGPLDLNTATLEQLDALPGVGPTTAQAILEHRRRHGRFRAVRDLLDVPGIGEAKFARLRELVRV